MKSLIYLAVLLSSFVSVPAGAAALPNSVEPLIVRSAMAETGLELVLANLQLEKTTITLTDLDAEETYLTETVRKHNGYSFSINLEELPEGRYCLSVKKGDTLRRQILLKTETGVMCSAWK